MVEWLVVGGHLAYVLIRYLTKWHKEPLNKSLVICTLVYAFGCTARHSILTVSLSCPVLETLPIFRAKIQFLHAPPLFNSEPGDTP